MTTCHSESAPASRLPQSTVLRSFVLIAAAGAAAAAQTGSAPTLINGSIDNSQLVTLTGNTHPLAQPAFDRGPAPGNLPMQRMLLVLTRSAEQEAALAALLDEQQQPASPNYHKWLTPQQFGQRFGLSDQNIQTITSWLESEGFQVARVSNGRTFIEFSGTADQVENTFHTTIHKYVVNGKEHWANASDPQVPAALAAAVAGIATLHNFVAAPQVAVSNASISAIWNPGSQPQLTSGGAHYLAPSDYATIYNINPLYQAGINGSGTVIAVVGRTDINTQDVVNFRTVFGLPNNPPNMIINGSDPGDLGGGEELEAVLDTSWAGAVAPNAQIDLVVSATTNTTDGITLSEEYIIDNNLGNVMTESFGDCEANYTQSQAAAISSMAQQAAAEGISYMVAAGDSGSAGCDNFDTETSATGPLSVNMLASSPYVVAVGGTQFNENGNPGAYWNTSNGSGGGSARSYIPEDVWNANCTGSSCGTGSILAGGGGASMFFSKPSWQSGVTGIPNDGARDLPDVALTAAGHDDYLICFHGSCSNSGNISFEGVYGTSASTPSFAGIMALVNQKTGSRQGAPNPALYRIAATESLANCNASNTAGLPASNCIFNDVTVGTNAVPGEANYNTSSETYLAAVGYDLASGLGSVNAANLVNGWSLANSAPAPVFTASPASGSGSSQTFTFTLADGGGVSEYTQVHILYNNTLNGNSACHLLYMIAANGLYLALDNVDQYSGPVTPGGSGTLSNSQCSVVAASVGVSITGTAITLTIPISFTSSFAGSRNGYMMALYDGTAQTAWNQVGTWTVTGGTTAGPVFTANPTSGSGSSQTFTFTLADSGGISEYTQVHILYNNTLNGNSACHLLYMIAANGLYLALDNVDQYSGPVTPGGSGTLSNSQCSIVAAGVGVSITGTAITLTIPISFTSSFAGSRNGYMMALYDGTAQTPWNQVGTWTVTGGTAGPVFTVNPSSGSGSSQTFTFTLADSGGISEYTQVHILYNNTLNGISACHLLYMIAANGLYLALDNVDQYSGPVTPGGSGTLSNSQCSVVAASVGVSITGTAITLTIPISFTSSFAGNRNGYMMALYDETAQTSWNQVGTWTVP